MAVLANELTNDPLARGYASMNDAEAAASLNEVNRSYTRESLTGNEVLHSIDPTEYAGLASNRPDLRTTIMGLCAVGGDISAAPGSFARSAFINIFGGASVTVTALAAKLDGTRSRAEELGLGGVSHTDVALARGRTG